MNLLLTENERELLYALPAVTNTQIVCGDCSGKEDRPRRTLLRLDGSCSNCGGRSYSLASNVFAGSAAEFRAKLRALGEQQELETLYRKEAYK